MKNLLNAMLVIILCFFGCNGKTDKKSTAQPKNREIVNNDSIDIESNNSVEKNTASSDSKYVEVKTWIDDFRNFRMAIYNNDVPQLKTYFSFPFEDKGHTIIGLCAISDADWIVRKKHFKDPQLFYEADLEKYHKKVFDERFTTAILKIKSEQLVAKHSTETKLFGDKDLIYKLYADYNEDEKTLMLNMSIGNNAKYPDGNYVSEGEHNIIYHFKIMNGKKLILIRVDMAG
ncbi:MAG: hypothetical protein ABIP95_03505 [Pelobium sp.]